MSKEFSSLACLIADYLKLLTGILFYFYTTDLFPHSLTLIACADTPGTCSYQSSLYLLAAVLNLLSGYLKILVSFWNKFINRRALFLNKCSDS